MNDSFEEYVTREKITADAIQQAARYYLGEKTNDLTPGEMREQIVKATGDSTAVDTAQHDLEANPAAVDGIVREFFHRAWEDPAEQEAIKRALRAATEKLPVIETAIIAMTVMYIAYLIATNGKEKEEEEETKDGRRSRKTKWAPPTAPLQNLVDLIRGRAKSR